MDTMKNESRIKPANPAELQLYPNATMSQASAETILPPTRVQREAGYDLDAARAFFGDQNQRIYEDRTDYAAMCAEIVELRKQERRDSVASRASNLIHVPKAHTTENIGLEAEYDSTFDGVNDRIERMTKAREWSLGMASWIDEGSWEKGLDGGALDKANKLRTCGSYLVFHEMRGLEQNRLAMANFCQQPKLCPLCALRRAAKEVQAHAPIVVQQVRDLELVPYMLTLTVKAGPNLQERLDHLLTSWRKLMKKRRNVKSVHNRHKGGEISKLAGGRYSVEIKRGSGSGQWHPHLHAVILSATPLDAEALSAEWYKATGDSFIVDVRPMHNAQAAMAERDPVVAAELIAADLVEVLKYPLKFGSMTHTDTWEAFRCTSGKQLAASFGCLRGVEIDKSYLDDPITGEDWPYVEVIARWMFGGYVVERGDDWTHNDDAKDYYRAAAIKNSAGLFSEAKTPKAKSMRGDRGQLARAMIASPQIGGGA